MYLSCLATLKTRIHLSIPWCIYLFSPLSPAGLNLILLDLRAAPMIIAWFWRCIKKHYQQTYFLLQGKILHAKYVVDKVECWSLCKSYNDGCKWFSYLIESNECYLFARCNNFNGNFHLPSVSGQAECKYDKVSGE